MFWLGIIIGTFIGGMVVTNSYKETIKKANDLDELKKWI